ncbi:MAG: sulfite exporter TauE/SafE family protein [Proteobacteria bacterium]|nr:sulfite exporter TauE/SafE family protein [Pseudomonadota bacterium]
MQRAPIAAAGGLPLHPGAGPVTALMCFLAGAVAWTLSSAAAGGGSMILAAAVSLIAPPREVAPVVSVASLAAALVRIALFHRLIDWRLVAWYLPGGVAGAIVGGLVFAALRSDWLQVLVGVFLLSAVLQYHVAQRRHWPPLPRAVFIPVSFLSGLVSAVVGASGLLANPFYLGHGLEKQALLATRAVNSLAIQMTKLAGYAAFGALTSERLLDGLAASAGASIAVAASNAWLDRMSSRLFRGVAIGVIVATGLLMLWRQRALVLALVGSVR